jgi:hypothetical protein
MPSRRPAVVVALALPLLPIACSSPRGSLPRIAELYSEAAKKEARNPVIVIHGVLGARLGQRSSGKTVWGAFTSDGFDPNTEEGARAIALPLGPPRSAADYDPEREDVYPAGPLEALELDVFFTVVSVEVYAGIIRTLGAGGYTDNVVVDPFSPAYSEDHFTCFSFFYDWRRDNVQNAIRLGRFIEAKRVEIAHSATAKIAKLRNAGTPAAIAEADELEDWMRRGYRFDVVAHSMGGLLANYYLRYGARDLPADGSPPEITWEGAEQIDRLIMVGTPNFGAMDALQNLVYGFNPSFLLPHFHPALLATMPSLFQLLPRSRHRLFVDEQGATIDFDLFDPAVWERNRWGLLDETGDGFLAWLSPGVEPEQRRAEAKAYQAWCLQRAERFHRALDARPATPCRTRLYLFASGTEDTLTRCRLRQRGGRLQPDFTGADLLGPGDGTVPRYSAVADERGTAVSRTWLDSPVPWSNVTFLADDHIGLTTNPYFSDNTLFLLLETPPP